MTSRAFDDRYAKLNERQRQAVDAIDGPVLVVAGPGSGKTELLAIRVANILKKSDVSPGNILCLTFTDSAAANMRKRLLDLMGEAAFRVSIHTFHSFATRIIDRHPEFFFEGAKFYPADPVIQIETLRSVFESLPHNHILKASHPEQGYVYLYDAKKRIEELKKAGISPKRFGEILDENEKGFSKIEKALKPLFDRLSKKDMGKYRAILDNLSFNEKIYSSFERALKASEDEDSTTPLSEWKKAWIRKDDSGKNIWKDRAYIDKLRGVRDIYGLYEGSLYKEGYFDFGDMILRVIQALETHDSLRAEIEETFQYILVDEFQDTNGAQMRLIELLTSSPVHEGKPNVMAVGDDDQAVYKFQGAEIDNIVSFKRMYKDPLIIALEENYRSTKGIIDMAEHVVGFNDNRLTHLIPGFAKKLKTARKDLPKGSIKKAVLPTPLHEMKFVADEVKKLIANGTSPKDIALIAREHSTLQSFMPYLHDRGIPVSYEKQRNVLYEEHVRELVTIARYIAARASGQPFSSDHLLPEILRYPFWGVVEADIWRLARYAMERDIPWTEALNASEDQKMRSIGEFLGTLAARSKSETAEYILDNLIGTLSVSFEDDEDAFPARLDFKSPFRSFYFSDEKLKNHKAQYLSFLSSLRTFIEALREYKLGRPLSLTDLIEFVDLREKNDIPLLDNSPFTEAESSVILTTAHKAKGQEFDVVFILSCQDDVWASGSSRNKLPLPINLPITPSSDSQGDFVRLFFVAITRARHTLYLTGYETEASGKQSLPLRFITGLPEALKGMEDITPTSEDHIETLELSRKSSSSVPKVKDERVLFEPILSQYIMSVTHLANFLDVSRGGPKYFFEQNLLRFPKAKTASGSFGTAIHDVLRHIHVYFKKEAKLPDEEIVREWFALSLRKERLSSPDEKHFFEKGISALSAYMKSKGQDIKATDEVEVNFKHEGVTIGAAHIGGQIDKIVREGNEITVVDYKTGSAVNDWEGSTVYEAMKLQKNKRQLLFYKLLVEGSNSFRGTKVIKGIIDFVEPKKGSIVSLETAFDDMEVERLSRLIEVVFKKIVDLDFPDVSKYSPDAKGIERFENDLLEGVI